MRLSLKLKATLLSSVLVAAALVVVGVVQYPQLERDFRGVVRDQLDTLGESIAEDLSSKLDLHLAVVEHDASTIDAATLRDPARRQDFVSRLAASRALFDGVALIGIDGVVLANHPPQPAGTRLSLADRPYFRRVREGTGSVVSEPIQSRTGRGPLILMLTPVRAASGEVLAYFSGGLLLESSNMLGTVSKAPVGRTGHLEIVTAGPNPVYVVHPDPARLLQPAPAVARGDLAIDYLSVAKPLRRAGWHLRLVLPQWEADAPLLEGQRRLFRELAVMGLAAAGLAWLAMTWLLRPLSRLHATMERLRRQPDSSEPVDTGSRDETGDLARSFDALMRETRTRQAEVQAIAERSPLGMFRAGPDGRLVYANAAYLAIHGLAADEAADGWLQLVDPAERENARAVWAAAVQRPEPLLVTRDLRRRDGSPCRLVVRSAPVIVDGEVVGHVGTVFDATERHAQERALRLLTTIFDSTPDYVVQTDREGFITYANPAVRRLEGLAPDAPVAHLNFAAFTSEATNRRFAAEILPAIKERGVWVGETTILDAQGREVPVNHMVIAHRDERSGRVEHFSAIMRDIREAVAARHDAARAAATLLSVADLTPASLTVVDNALCYRFVNSAFEQRTGRAREQIVGRHASEVLTREEYEFSLPFAQRALAGETVDFERVSRWTTGTKVLAISYVPVRLATGEIDGFVGVAQDITQHRLEAIRWRDRSERDPLTGVLNRAGFESCLQLQIQGGGGARLALLYLDLDRFKPVNDQHGHAAGDEVLRVVAQRLQRQVRPTDVVARLGGDEFAVLLVDVPDEATARVVAAKLARALAEPIPVGAHVLGVGASVGVVHGVQPGEGGAAFVARADRRMFEAKGSRR